MKLLVNTLICTMLLYALLGAEARSASPRQSEIVPAQAPGGTADTAQQGPMIDPCRTPLRVRLQGIPPQGGASVAEYIDTCGHREMSELAFDLPQTVAPLSSEARARLPRLELLLRAGKLDVRLALAEGKTVFHCDAKQLAVGATGVPLQCAADTAAPALKVSIESLHDDDYVSIHALDATPQQLLSELARVEHLEFHHAERLGASRITFILEIVPVRMLLNLIALESGVVVLPDGAHAWVFGTVKHAAAIEALRIQADAQRENGEDMALRTTLHKIVNLSTPADADDLPAYAGDEMAALVELMIADTDYAGAEAMATARLAQIERFWGRPEGADYALALAGLARAQIRRSGRKATMPKLTLTLSLALMKRYPPASGTPEDVRALADLVDTLLKSGNVADANALGLYAHTIMQAEDDRWNIYQSAHARLAAVFMHQRLGLALEARGDDRAATMHLEWALSLGEAALEDNTSMMFLREVLIAIARRAGQEERVARYTAMQAGFIKADGGTTRYSDALSMLSVVMARKSDYVAAIKAWEQVAAFRQDLFGKNSSATVDALRDLALLHRMNGEESRALEIEARADVIGPVARDVAALGAGVDSLNLEMGLSIVEELSSEFVERLVAKGVPATDPTVMLMRERALNVRIARHRSPIAALGVALEMETLWSAYLHSKGARHSETRRLALRAIELFNLAGKQDGAERVRQQMPGLKEPGAL